MDGHKRESRGWGSMGELAFMSKLKNLGKIGENTVSPSKKILDPLLDGHISC